MSVCCTVHCTTVPLIAIAGNGWPHNALRYHQLIPISCHFRDCKALLFESTHVSSAIASTQTFTFLPFTCGELMTITLYMFVAPSNSDPKSVLNLYKQLVVDRTPVVDQHPVLDHRPVADMVRENNIDHATNDVDLVTATGDVLEHIEVTMVTSVALVKPKKLLVLLPGMDP